ncbi:7,8-dihydro-8-oxoguanine triphosphatase-like [Mizuhopecten yessoensis]|uniref:Oxidized purine nucleoside triphosphate hydrolase n=1 Tax=Mizuhopecten yessoensis TaxID=6573 RepID=A0A210QSX7_MIZYE|nr:7,8-dihydro-8-oxoguanine triphosphatase-like [Mizuhopecten yessoensis]XP_021350535.1 7,8-dihydro-8-oxoguanine triphosphatase-like [Mizuhopecten yessoensis]XP_021350536.1 7,8-dihydro-8-oxoguanine triphosphatase-like [Mizuhopecten yessoensis]OWF51812.1 7,8-dihydro-8-oxoguanine triphosphatase [Mizuhopecten yessoensis]
MVANKLLTLVLLRQAPRILLGMKKRGFGVGRWNGFGGKVEPGETIKAAARRELLEESCLVCNDLKEVGLLKFEFLGNPQIWEVHVFTSNNFEGEAKETEEMRPQWFEEKSIPFDQMWPDDILWFPHFLNGKKFSGYIVFEGMDKMVKYDVEEVESIDSAAA